LGSFPREDPERFLPQDKIKIHVDEGGKEPLEPLHLSSFLKLDVWFLE
jgi:hypothetical protein